MILDATKRLLLTCLADGSFHSGEALARIAGISRAAVWKQLRGLQDGFGVEVDTVKGKGYRLRGGMELLDADRILEHIDSDAASLIGGLTVLETVDSTNRWLMAKAAEGTVTGWVCLAEHQTAGRGRHGRAWVSPFGANLYLSVLWRFELAPVELSGLSIACGVAAARALTRVGATGISLKWPNDVLWERRKLAGLLLEVRGESSGPSHVVAGIGVNTRMPRLGAALVDQPWADLDEVTGAESQSRNRLAALIAGEMLTAMATYATTGLRPFLEAWCEFDHFRGEEVILQVGPREVRGRYLGVLGDGAIHIDVGGHRQLYNVGEVSLCRRG
jgi:BirA family biotin operon repressor/biotin-[acetyl-CoA-carboxylase] ligase